jgi:hypothetical protein
MKWFGFGLLELTQNMTKLTQIQFRYEHQSYKNRKGL